MSGSMVMASHPDPGEAKKPSPPAARPYMSFVTPIHPPPNCLSNSTKTFRRRHDGVPIGMALTPGRLLHGLWGKGIGLLSATVWMPPPKPQRSPKDGIVVLADDEEPVPSFRNEKTRTAGIVALIGAVCAGLAVTIVPIAQAYINRPPPAKANFEEVLKVLKEESERHNKEIQKSHDDVVELRSWIKGYLTAQGYVIQDPPDANAPSATNVEIESPRTTRKRLPPSQVSPPLPALRPLTRAKEIPEPVSPKAAP